MAPDAVVPQPVLRPEVAAAQISALRTQRVLLDGENDALRAEVERLRGVVADQSAQITALQDRVRRLQTVERAAALEQVVRAFAEALRVGGQALEGRTISSATAELRLPLQLTGASIEFGDPSTVDPTQLSTIRFDLQALPAPPGADAQPSAPATDAAARTAAALATFAVRLARGLGALLAPPQPTEEEIVAPRDPYEKLRPPLTALAGIELSSPPTAAELAAAAAALEALAQAVEELAGVA